MSTSRFVAISLAAVLMFAMAQAIVSLTGWTGQRGMIGPGDPEFETLCVFESEVGVAVEIRRESIQRCRVLRVWPPDCVPEWWRKA